MHVRGAQHVQKLLVFFSLNMQIFVFLVAIVIALSL